MNTSNAQMGITISQLEIMRHALGLDGEGRGTEWRNHYICDPEPSIDALVDRGLMRNDGANAATGYSPCFRVTKEGKSLVREHAPKREKLSRSQRRYREFLSWADAYHGNFRQYLAYLKHKKTAVVSPCG